MVGELPDFVVAGAPRCGTSSPARRIFRHPEVVMTAEEVLRFLDRGVKNGWTRTRVRAATDEDSKIGFSATGDELLLSPNTPVGNG